jgi:kynurenine formamidase
MKLIDVTVPLDANLPTSPGNTPFRLVAIKRRAVGDSSNVSNVQSGTIVIEGLNLRDVDPGTYEMFCLPLALVGSDGAPARLVLRRN